MSDNLQKLIELAKADGGKFFVIDEKGRPSLVIMGVAEYEKLLVRKVEGQISDIEEINHKIMQAQKEEDAVQARKDYQDSLKSEVIDSTFSFDSAPNLENEEI